MLENQLTATYDRHAKAKFQSAKLTGHFYCGIESCFVQTYPCDKSTFVINNPNWLASSCNVTTVCPCFLKNAGTSRREPGSESRICKLSPADTDFNASLTLTKGTGQRNDVKSIKIIMNLLWMNLGYYPKLQLKLQAKRYPSLSWDN